ncbi:N-acetyltransferase family protein [Rummeliibacillus sp. JY-2-4R]
MEKTIEKKYIPLAAYFEALMQDQITLTFSEIETIMGQPLPNASYLNKSWWMKTKPPLKHFTAWTEYGYHVTDIKLGYHITFEKPSTNLENSIVDSLSIHPTYIIRPIELDDAREVIRLYQQLFVESDYMVYGDKDHSFSVQGFRKLITNWKATNSAIILVAIINGEIGGAISILVNRAIRKIHCASITIGVLEKFANNSIGTSLISEAERWARTHNISRLELSVIESNQKAISLFEKFGFTVEGKRYKSVKINSSYEDELYMGKLFI